MGHDIDIECPDCEGTGEGCKGRCNETGIITVNVWSAH